jgi:hypothetical protein
MLSMLSMLLPLPKNGVLYYQLLMCLVLLGFHLS